MGDFGVARDKWVCPNDRELSLRAKLKTGWSVKTNSINSFSKPEQLNDAEQEVIMSVIRRAENLEKVEQERVGRLVERLENMKKNAMGNGATQCVLCADEFGILGASSLLCNDCKKAVCTKCGVDTVSAQKEAIWLCKICAETRETWKKTGAWFYKGLPKYILPSKKCPLNTLTRPTHSTPYNSWLQSKEKEGIEKENTDSSDDEFKSSRLAKRATNRKPYSEPVEPANVLTPPPDTSPTYGFSPTDLPQHIERRSPAHEGSMYPREEEERYRVRRDEGRVHQEGKVTNTDVHRYRPGHRAQDVYVEKVSPEDSCNASLEFSLLFDAHNQVLHCTIYRAKGMKATDIDGLADPFVRLHLMPIQSKMDKMRTRTVHKTLNPEFNEAVSFYGISDYDISKRTLRMSVMDEDIHRNENLGEVRVALKRLKPQQPSHATIYLEKPRPDDIEEENCRGQILLSLLFSDEHNALVISVNRCVRLPSRDNNGFPDPFVRIQVKPDASRRQFKTSTKKKTFNPEFNEQYALEMERGEMAKKTIEVTVWDKDYSKTDVYLGGVALNMQSKNDRLRHWMDVLRKPNRRIERWHPLSNILFID